MICPSAAHMNPKVYEDPSVFNPWRWKVRKTRNSHALKKKRVESHVNIKSQKGELYQCHCMHVCRVLLSLLEAPRISWPLEAVCGYVWVQTLPSCKCLSSSTAYSPSTGTILLFQKRKTLRKFRTIWQVNVVLTCMNRWKVISGGTMVFYPGLRFPDGFHIHLLPKD